jgi:cation transport ATPase
MLIIDYSCGVRLSTATALSAAIATAARNGILVKGSNYLEMLADADTVVLDKTGTVTEGRPQVTSIIPTAPGVTEREIIELAAAAEETSTHPVAIAFVDKARRQSWLIPAHGPTQVSVGRGVQTSVGGANILAWAARTSSWAASRTCGSIAWTWRGPRRRAAIWPDAVNRSSTWPGTETFWVSSGSTTPCART